MRIALFLVFGLVCGALTAMLLPGRTPRGWLTSMVIGAAGSMVGGLLGSALGLNTEGSRLGFLVSVLGALAWVGVYHLIRHRAGLRPSHDGSRRNERRSADGGRRSTDHATGLADDERAQEKLRGTTEVTNTTGGRRLDRVAAAGDEHEVQRH